jgi:hypothetical protein
MSPALENLVRPFLPADIRPNAASIGTVQTQDTVVLMCGSPEGQITSQQGSRSASITSYTEGQEQEVSRDVTPVRVKNPDDPDQHVDVDVTTRLSVARKDGEKVTKSGQTYADVQATDNTEVLGPSRTIDSTKASGGWPTSWKK